jgi:hypothetical protein
MPRIRKGLGPPPPPRFPGLIEELVCELKAERESGQPTVEEFHFPRTNRLRVTVTWDKWEPVPDDARAEVIRLAYEQAEGKEFRDRIALCVGLTVPEARESGLLPFQVEFALRPGDAVNSEQCRQALLAEGASTLTDPERPELRFASLEEAQACVRRLTARLPRSEAVWMIAHDVARPA